MDIWVRGLHRWHKIEPELTFRFQQILAQQLMLEVESTPTGPLLLATTSLLGRVCLSPAGELRLSIAEAILAPLAHHNLEPRMCQNFLRILAYCRSVFHCLDIDFLAKFARIFTNWEDDGLTREALTLAQDLAYSILLDDQLELVTDSIALLGRHPAEAQRLHKLLQNC